MEYLADVYWGRFSGTDYYTSLKQELQDVVEDLCNPKQSKEIVIHDILEVFRVHGFEVIQVDESRIDTSIYE